MYIEENEYSSFLHTFDQEIQEAATLFLASGLPDAVIETFTQKMKNTSSRLAMYSVLIETGHIHKELEKFIQCISNNIENIETYLSGSGESSLAYIQAYILQVKRTIFDMKGESVTNTKKVTTITIRMDINEPSWLRELFHTVNMLQYEYHTIHHITTKSNACPFCLERK